MAKALSRKVTIYINGREVQSTLQSLEGEMRKLQAEQKKMTIGSEEYIKTSMKIREINAVISEQKNAVKGMGNEWKSTTQRVAEFANVVTGLNSAFQMIDLGVGKLKDLAKDAAALDDIYADVMKTTGMTHDQVESLNEAFKKMDTRTAREHLNQLAYEAGKLGINSEEAVRQFVSAANKINIALGDVLGEGAMVTVGKLTNIYESTSKTLEGKNLEEKMLAIGSAVNSLGQASTANEGYLVEFMKRVGGIAGQAKLSADQILGFASALDQQGQAVEMSATAFTKLIMQMVKKPEEFVQAAGVSLEEFKRMMDEDMNGAVMRVLSGMNSEGGFQQLVAMFKDMGLDGARAASAVSALANHLDQVTEAQTLAYQEMMTGNSVLQEFNTKNDTMQAKAEKAKKKFEEMRIELGNELYPILIHLQKTGTVLMKGVAGFVQIIKENKAVLIGLVALMANWLRMKVLNIAADGKLVTGLKSLLGVEKLKAHQQDVLIAKQKKKIAADEQERLETIKAELAKQKKIAAMKVEKNDYSALTLKTMAQANAEKLEAAAEAQAQVATNAHTAAIKAQKLAFSSTPWGLVITALTSIAGLIVGIVKNSQKWKVNEMVKEVGAAGAEAEGKIRVLKDRLDESKKGTDDYRQALEELKAMYPDIIKQFVDEKGALEDVKGALEAVSAASRKAAMDQMYNQKAGEIYAEQAEKIQEAMAEAYEIRTRFANSVNFWKEGTTDAQREEAWRRYTEWVRKAQEGTVSWDEAIEGAKKDLGDFGYVLTSTFGTGSRDMIYQMREMKKASEEADSSINLLNVTLKNVYGYGKEEKPTPAVRSIQDIEREMNNLNAHIRLNQKEVDRLNKKLKGEKNAERRNHILQMIQHWTEEINKAKNKLIELKNELNNRNTNNNNNNNGGGGGGGYSGPRKETPAEKRARLAEEAWQRFENNYDRLIEKMDAKTLTGAAKIVADVDNGIKKMKDDLEAVLKKHPEAKKMIDELDAKAKEWKSAQLDVYIEKLKDAYWKLAETVGDTDAAGRLMAESDKLQDAIANIDKAIEQAEADATVATGEHQKELQRLIAYYRELKAEIGGELYRRVQEVQSTFEVIEEQVWNPDTGEWVIQPTIKVNKAQMEKQTKDAGEAIKKLIEGIEIEPTAFQKWCNKNLDIVEDFADKALSIFSNINTILNNISDQRIKDLEDEKDANIKTLDEQLEQGLISQETYDQKKQDIENEYNEKANEEKKKQWQRDKAFSLSEATIAAALAAVKVWAAEGTTAYKVAMSALLAAELATQIAAIASQPEPYAKGGYVDRDTVFRAGEAGREWIASNRLLNDPVAGPTIEALESYQRGNRRALGDIPMARMNMPVAMAAARELGSRTTSSSSGRITASKGDEMLKVMKELASYLEDPKNRQAIISRQTMTDFDTNEQFLRSRASI